MDQINSSYIPNGQLQHLDLPHAMTHHSHLWGQDTGYEPPEAVVKEPGDVADLHQGWTGAPIPDHKWGLFTTFLIET